MITKEFFGHMVQGEWVLDSGYADTSVFFGVLNFWDSRAVWHKMLSDLTALEANILYAQRNRAESMFTFGEPHSTAVEAGYSKVPRTEDWLAFVRRVVTEARGRIKYYGLWNEPGLPQYWDGSAERLLHLCATAYPLIKSLQPDSIVLSPSITEPGLARGIDFWDPFIGMGGLKHCDGVAMHGYSHLPEHVVGDILSVRAMMAKYGVDKPLYDTEFTTGELETYRRVYMGQAFVVRASLGIKMAVWNAEIPGAEDYDDLTMGDIRDMLIGAEVGPMERRDEGWVVPVLRPGARGAEEIAWTRHSFPVIRESVPYSLPGSQRRGCWSKFF